MVTEHVDPDLSDFRNRNDSARFGTKGDNERHTELKADDSAAELGETKRHLRYFKGMYLRDHRTDGIKRNKDREICVRPLIEFQSIGCVYIYLWWKNARKIDVVFTQLKEKKKKKDVSNFKRRYPRS